MKRFNLLILSIVSGLFLMSCVSQKSSIPGVSSVRAMPSTDIYQADIDIPEIADEPELNKLISDQINNWFDDFINNTELNRQVAENFGQPFTFENQWHVTLNSKDCTSVLLTAYQFTGGANGEDKLASITWSKLANKTMSIEEFLPLVLEKPSLESLAQACRQQLTISLVAENNPSLMDMIDSGTEPVPENYDIFTISDLGLTVYFEKYQVAPGSEGTQAVLLPYRK